MPPTEPNCPATRARLIDLYFMEHRAKLLDLASFLDRIDRASDGPEHEADFRLAALREALHVLLEDRPDRARRVLELLSDHSTDPIPSAAGMKGAFGAYPGTPADGDSP